MTDTIKRISLPVLLALLLSGCATTSAIRPQNNAQNSQTFYSPIRLYDANEHIAIANNFCKDKNKAEIAKINTHRDSNRHGDIMRTTFFCGTPEKIQQIEEQQALEKAQEALRKEQAQKVAEENRQAEAKRKAYEAENAAKVKIENRKKRIELISKITPKAPGQLAYIGDGIKDNTLHEDFCSKIVGITASAEDDLASAWRISSYSIRLVSSRLVGGTAACCLKLDTPKGPFQNAALDYYINSKKQIFVTMNNRGYREGESNHLCTLF